MQLKDLLKNSALSALAVALGVTALPAEASAQWRNKGERTQEHQQGERSERGSSQGQAQRQAPPQQAQQRQAPPQRAQQAETRSARDGNRGENRAQVAQERSGRDWNRSERSGDNSSRNSPQVARNDDRRGEWRDGNRQVERGGDRSYSDRNRTYSDRDRNRSYDDDRRDNYRDGNRDGYRDGTRHVYNDGRRDGYREARRDHRQWDRRWRDNHRYNWYNYRNSNHNLYRIGRYYSPYRSYSYRRLNIGFHLDSLFFGSRYWINDPWQYRLPAVHGSYRWVRYYDDVLLVDTYSGEVVDVIHNFFW